MEINLSVQTGMLALTSADTVCSEEALEGASISFKGSRSTIDHALSGLVYWVRPLPRIPCCQGHILECFNACMSPDSPYFDRHVASSF